MFRSRQVSILASNSQSWSSQSLVGSPLLVFIALQVLLLYGHQRKLLDPQSFIQVCSVDLSPVAYLWFRVERFHVQSVLSGVHLSPSWSVSVHTVSVSEACPTQNCFQSPSCVRADFKLCCLHSLIVLSPKNDCVICVGIPAMKECQLQILTHEWALFIFAAYVPCPICGQPHHEPQTPQDEDAPTHPLRQT